MVVAAELLQGPVGEVFMALGAVFGVEIEGEALGMASKTPINESEIKLVIKQLNGFSATPD
jgi:hypothetical protein